ncbi:MAG: tRNA (guanosine(46)-N7)-methyltransferase TrmB [Clostridia bacterium]|nr:tRNA (guanosine(46)-N7)-methyltransferase TrmB [Clostridia bacterium]
MRIRKRTWTKQELEEAKFYIDKPQENKGKWKSAFDVERPIHLELGCGKGQFIAKLACQNPNINFIGVDLIDTMLGLAKRNIEEIYKQANRQVDNVIITRCNIEQILDMMDKEDVVKRIYINFCNPWPRGKHHKKRLTHVRQLELYKTFLEKGGEIYFKTDDDNLFSDSLAYFKNAGYEIFWKTYDLHHENIEGNIITEHENMFSKQGIKIKALKAKYGNA